MTQETVQHSFVTALQPDSVVVQMAGLSESLEVPRGLLKHSCVGLLSTVMTNFYHNLQS